MRRGRKDWDRLGRLLVDRRVFLGYTNRSEFFRERGVKKSQQRLLIALENRERENFTRPTLSLAEQTYEWASGSVEAVLNGGNPTTLEESLGVRVRRDLSSSDLRRDLHALIDNLSNGSLSQALKVLRAVVDD